MFDTHSRIRTCAMAATGFDYVVRKKMINKQLRDMSQLADIVRRIEKLNSEKEKQENRKKD